MGKNIKTLSIRQHVTLLTLLPLTVLSIALASLYLYHRYADLERQLELRSATLVKEFAINSAHALYEKNGVLLNNIVLITKQQPEVQAIVLLDAKRHPLVYSGELAEIYGGSFSQESHLVLDSHAQMEVSGLDARYLLVKQAIYPDQIGLMGEALPQSMLGFALLVIDRQAMLDHKQSLLLLTLFTLLLVLIFPFYFLYSAGRNISRPIEQLSRVLGQLPQTNEQDFSSISSNITEVQRLIQGVGEMSAQLKLERAVLEQRIYDATEELTIQKERAERISGERGKFLAVASHDLRQPIHAIGLYVSELQRRLNAPDQFGLLEKIEASLESLSGLLGVLLDISKLDAGVVLPQYRTCQISDVFQHVVANFEMLAMQKEITLRTRVHNVWVTTDSTFLERILSNLVSNAIRYTPKGGKVMVLCRKRHHTLRIEVRDNGVGIADHDQNNIFQAFVQLNHPAADKNKGMGLGLAIVDRLARLLNCNIKLSSQAGCGSKFYFDLPLADTRTDEIVVRDIPSTDVAQKDTHQILVVDDDPLVRLGTANVLTSWGFKVETAESLTQVEQLLAENKYFDLVISDYHLEPNITGIDVLQRVQQQLGPVPCIIISGETGLDLVKQANQFSYALLHKPVKPAKLRSLILYKLNNTGLG